MNIRRLTLETNNLETMKDFYGSMLELSLVQEGQALKIQIGSSELVFLENPDSNAKYHIAFNIPEQQLEVAKNWLEARVPLVQDEHGITVFASVTWSANQVYFYDSAGNILELIARHDLSHEAVEPFDSSGLLNISEIGLAVPKTTEFAAWLETHFGILAYRDNSSDFMPLGDANGLIIVVADGREWYPNTGIIAKSFYTKIEFAVGAGLLDPKAAPNGLGSLASPVPTVQYLDLPYFFSRV